MINLKKRTGVYLYYCLIYLFYFLIKFAIYILPFLINYKKKFNTERFLILKKLIKSNFKKKINVLEIGTHFGLGSTQILIKEIPKNSTLTCVDKWNHKIITKFDFLLPFLSTITNTSYNNINIIRAPSTFINQLKDNNYDLIYIDGSHHYNEVKKDILNAKKLANKNFSIICGDDCELSYSKENYRISKNLVKKKIEKYSTNKQILHPGVFLAVHEIFKKVTVENGFWYHVINKNFKTKIKK
jgi:predicted O-methyltransferase YrrM